MVLLGKWLKAARHADRFVVFGFVLLASIAVVSGCSHDAETTAPITNQPPQLYLMNVPPGEEYLYDEQLTWYALDADGEIDRFAFTVVAASHLILGGELVTPDAFVVHIGEANLDWTTAEPFSIDPDHGAEVTLVWNVDFTVDPDVTEFLFVRVCDTEGAWSEAKWRMFSPTNHYPQTDFRSHMVYVNAVNETSSAPGVRLSWRGFDPEEYAYQRPYLQYEWRLYGPFKETTPMLVEIVDENCVYDPILDSIVYCDQVPVLDIANIPPNLLLSREPIRRSQGPNIDIDPYDVWVSDTEVVFYDLLDEVDADTTGEYKFVFWVRARDDGLKFDSTPPFSQIMVIDPQYEHSVAVFDETMFTPRAGRWAPRDLDLVKAMFQEYVAGAGYADFDTAADFYFSANRKNTEGLPIEPKYPELLDLFSYKTVIYHNDDVESGPYEGVLGLIPEIYFVYDMGIPVWGMSRNLGNIVWTAGPFPTVGLTEAFNARFGLYEYNGENWLNGVFADVMHPVFNEEFIGAVSQTTELPDMDVDFDRLDTYYPRMFVNISHKLLGSPEIGTALRSEGTMPLYLYRSRLGESSAFQAGVCAVKRQVNGMKSACFLFTPPAMEPIATQTMFTSMLDWLMADWYRAPQAYKTNGAVNAADIERRRERTALFLDYLNNEADAEILELYGIRSQR